MNTNLKLLLSALALTLAASGIPVIVVDSLPDSVWGERLAGFNRTLFGTQLFCWMVLGMVANYFWDLLKEGKTLTDVQPANLMLPVLVSPIVFFGIWSLWPENTAISFALTLVAFQNGFFLASYPQQSRSSCQASPNTLTRRC